MQRIVGRIEIQGDLRGRFAVRIEEDVNEQALERIRVGGKLPVAGWNGTAQLQPVQRALAGQWSAVRTPRRKLAGQDRQHRIMTQFVMVDQVFVTERYTNDPLHHQGLDRMLDECWIARVGEAASQTPGQSDNPVRCPQKQRSRVRGDPATIECRNHRTSLNACKIKQVRVTLCLHRGSPLLAVKPLLQKNFRSFRGPVHPIRVRKAG